MLTIFAKVGTRVLTMLGSKKSVWDFFKVFFFSSSGSVWVLCLDLEGLFWVHFQFDRLINDSENRDFLSKFGP